MPIRKPSRKFHQFKKGVRNKKYTGKTNTFFVQLCSFGQLPLAGMIEKPKAFESVPTFEFKTAVLTFSKNEALTCTESS